MLEMTTGPGVARVAAQRAVAKKISGQIWGYRFFTLGGWPTIFIHKRGSVRSDTRLVLPTPFLCAVAGDGVQAVPERGAGPVRVLLRRRLYTQMPRKSGSSIVLAIAVRRSTICAQENTFDHPLERTNCMGAAGFVCVVV